MWKTIPNFDNYEASEDGRVRNKLTNTELKLTLGTDKYLKVMLCKDNRRYTKRVNRVIAETFLPNDQNFPQVNHINGVKTDNRVSNLEWCTAGHNVAHSYETRLNPNSVFIKVTDLIDNTVKQYRSIKLFAKTLGLTMSVIVPYIANSKTYPFMGRYVIEVNNPDELLQNSNTKTFGKKVYVYDFLTKELKTYPSLTVTSYYTGIRSLHLLKHSLIRIGYYITFYPETINYNIKYDPGVILLARSNYYAIPFNKSHTGVKLYNYYTKQEKLFLTRREALEYLNSLEPLDNVISNSMLNEKISYANKGKTYLVKGFGTKTDNPDLDDLPYYPWTEEAILSSRDGCKAITKYYDVNGKIIRSFQGVLDYTNAPKELHSYNLTNKIQVYFDTHGYTVKRLNKPIS